MCAESRESPNSGASVGAAVSELSFLGATLCLHSPPARSLSLQSDPHRTPLPLHLKSSVHTAGETLGTKVLRGQGFCSQSPSWFVLLPKTTQENMGLVSPSPMLTPAPRWSHCTDGSCTPYFVLRIYPQVSVLIQRKWAPY